MKIEIFKFKKNFRKGGAHSNPDLFWQLYLLFGIVVVVCAAVFGTILFLKVNKEPVENVTTAKGGSQIISEERIDASLNYFSVRKQYSNQIINSPSPVIDPSL